MSLKSRTRTVKKRERQSHFDPLVDQKHTIRTAMLEYLGAAVLFGVVAIVVTIMALIDDSTTRNTSGVIFAEIVVCVIFVYFLLSFVRRFIIFWHFKKMIFSTEQSVITRRFWAGAAGTAALWRGGMTASARQPARIWRPNSSPAAKKKCGTTEPTAPTLTTKAPSITICRTLTAS